MISFPHNCDGRRQQEECVGVGFGRKAGDVSALLSLAGRRRKKKRNIEMKNSELSLTSQMLVAALQISAPVFSQRPKQLLPFFFFSILFF